MFNGFLKPKFYSKCKTDIRLTKTRLENITKKRNAVEKYLKKDIVDLLKNGLDYNAYGRAEGLINEQNMSCCYAFIDQFCGSILSNLAALQKESECPEECREAVSSLMFAAARFADLPELRDLRNLFTAKYGNSLENFVNKEFVGRLKAKPPSKEMKLQMLKDIAAEISLQWDSKQLEQKLFTPPAVHEPKCESPEKTEDASNSWHIRERRHFFPEESMFQRPKETNDVSVKLNASRGKDEEQQEQDKKILNWRPSYRNIPPPYIKATTENDTRVPDKPQENKPAPEAKQKPRSMRQIRRLKPPPGHEGEDSPRSMTDDPKDTDEEEKVMDGLLMHYAKKNTSPYELSSQLKGPLNPSPLRESNYSHDSKTWGWSDGWKPRFGNQHARASSMPAESASSTDSDSSDSRSHSRAISFQNEMFRGHVHPNLPDYDDLASRIAALRGR